MANPDKPNGFKLVGKLGGSVQNNGVQNYKSQVDKLVVSSLEILFRC